MKKKLLSLLLIVSLLALFCGAAMADNTNPQLESGNKFDLIDNGDKTYSETKPDSDSSGNGSGNDAPAHSHSYKAVKTVEPSCTEKGYTRYECKGCGDTYRANYKDKLMHWFDLWVSNGDGTHSADCKRSGCSFTAKNECTLWTANLGDAALTVCPVCGGEGFEAIADAAVEGEKLPKGEKIVRGLTAPVDGALYAFTVAYEYSGRTQEFKGSVTVSLPLSAEMGEFKLVRVIDGVETEISYSLTDGVLSFETDCDGLFLLIPVVTEATEAPETAEVSE